MTRRRRRHAALLASLMLIALGVPGLSAGQQPATPARPAAPGTVSALAPDKEPWPDAATLEKNKVAAANRPLFASSEPIEFTLLADFGAVQRDREESNRTYPATLVVARQDGTDASIEVRIRTRGHSRRKPTSCTFAPLRIEFPVNPVGTVFEGQKNLKLGTHCRDTGEYPQYVVREYPAYRMFNLLTPRSFRARLAEAHYVDAKSQKPVRARTALFIEDDDEMARRLGGRALDLRGLAFRQLNITATIMMSVFEYMIGNTDMSIIALHNVVIVQTPDGVMFPVPYDFDYSGVVNAPYAAVAPTLKLSSVRSRLYRGPCRDAEELEAFLARFRTLRAEMFGVYDAIPQLTPKYVREAKEYLEGFYRTINDPANAKRAFIDGCSGRPYL